MFDPLAFAVDNSSFVGRLTANHHRKPATADDVQVASEIGRNQFQIVAFSLCMAKQDRPGKNEVENRKPNPNQLAKTIKLKYFAPEILIDICLAGIFCSEIPVNTFASHYENLNSTSDRTRIEKFTKFLAN